MKRSKWAITALGVCFPLVALVVGAESHKKERPPTRPLPTRIVRGASSTNSPSSTNRIHTLVSAGGIARGKPDIATQTHGRSRIVRPLRNGRVPQAVSNLLNRRAANPVAKIPVAAPAKPRVNRTRPLPTETQTPLPLSTQRQLPSVRRVAQPQRIPPRVPPPINQPRVANVKRVPDTLPQQSRSTRPSKAPQPINRPRVVDVERVPKTLPEPSRPARPSTPSYEPTKADLEAAKSRPILNSKQLKHWAFIPPKAAPHPRLPQHGHRLSPIDTFVLARLSEAKFNLSPQATREVLARRVSLDLTGLPPTPAELTQFLEDQDPHAYEKLVDRLLASERFGERMALEWMDASRYGDTSVMHADGFRTMWPWRDYVINAFNDNMPFDQFTIEQLAGDLIPNATVQQKVASGFNRNHGTTDEEGVDSEEMRVEYVVDRVKTTATVWMALGMECAQCHDHTHDPISQRDYYHFFAFFNNNADPGIQTKKGNQRPFVSVPMAPTPGLTQAEKNLADHKRAGKQQLDQWLAGLSESGLPEPVDLVHQFPLENRNPMVTDGNETKRVAGASTPADCVDSSVEESNADAEDKVDFDFGEAFTIAGWIKPNDAGSYAIVSKLSATNDNRGFDLRIEKYAIGTHLIDRWPNRALRVFSRNRIPGKQWTHFALTHDGSRRASGIKIFLSGKPAATHTTKDTLRVPILTNAPFRIGNRNGTNRIKAGLSDLRLYSRELKPIEIRSLAERNLALAAGQPRRSESERALLEEYFYQTQDTAYPALIQAVQKAKHAHSRRRVPTVTSMIMQDQAGRPRPTYVMNRGQFDQPNKNQLIVPDIPRFLGTWPSDTPRNRLGLAQWLTRPDHPLTSRVAVNRIWGMLFGQGLVRTQGDFGALGERPSHPKLLDWLAVDFVRHSWDIKRLVKQIVMSKAYQQASRVSAELQQLDPSNRLLARGPRFRLAGEFIRDHALAVSGLLTGQIGGASAKPYQPPNIWTEVSLEDKTRYQQDRGPSLYRRSLYTYWRRSSPMPNMLIFDVPTREKCVVQRHRTNTPLQALVTLNDTQFVEAARAMAQRLIKEGGLKPETRIDLAFRLAISRSASKQEIKELRAFMKRQLNEFRQSPGRTRAYLGVGESQRDRSIDAAEHAAWMTVCQIILNLDETLTRG